MNSFLDDKSEPEKPSSTWADKLSREPEVIGLFESGPERRPEGEVAQTADPESAGETARRSGLAFSAGVAFFSAVVFMMVVGWFADLLFGSSPYGLVGGIVLGSVIGFIQLFRLSSQIFQK